MKQLTKLFILLLCALACNRLSAQKHGQPLIDSLLQELPKQKQDTNKAKMLATISYLYYNINPDEGIKYGGQALELATKLGWEKGISSADNAIGVNYYRESDYPTALGYYEKALKIDEEMGNLHGVATVTINIGLVYQSHSDFPTALAYDLKNLKLVEQIGDKYSTAIICGNIGNIYRSQGDYPKALEYDFKALKIKEELGDKSSIAISVGNISIVYRYQKNYKMAMEYGEKALKMAEETGNKYLVAADLCSIGSAYLSMVSDTDVKSGPGRAACLRTAIGYLQRSVAAAREIHAPDVMQECDENLSAVYKLSGDYGMALEYANKGWAIKDSVFSKKNNDKIVKMEMNIEYEKKRVETQKTATLKLQREKAFTSAGIAGILLLAGFSFFIVKERRKSEYERIIAEQERKKSDDLLLNILPSEVAAELKTKGTTTAKNFDHVTVLFTDFVNFTRAGERMSPETLIDELHACFKTFDEITGKYNIEKIKTIGDAYLAVAGLPAADPKHAENVITAAIEINNFMRERQAKLGNSTFGIRIGIHSGSVVAGIVGVKKFAYDIWGDTVNIAALMQQNSKAGRINISETTCELAKDMFTCEYRGEIEVKNKGPLKMYFING